MQLTYNRRRGNTVARQAKWYPQVEVNRIRHALQLPARLHSLPSRLVDACFKLFKTSRHDLEKAEPLLPSDAWLGCRCAIVALVVDIATGLVRPGLFRLPGTEAGE